MNAVWWFWKKNLRNAKKKQIYKPLYIYDDFFYCANSVHISYNMSLFRTHLLWGIFPKTSDVPWYYVWLLYRQHTFHICSGFFRHSTSSEDTSKLLSWLPLMFHRKSEQMYFLLFDIRFGSSSKYYFPLSSGKITINWDKYIFLVFWKRKKKKPASKPPFNDLLNLIFFKLYSSSKFFNLITFWKLSIHIHWNLKKWWVLNCNKETHQSKLVF